MAKIFFTFASVLMCLATVRSTNSKFVKTVPTITNSLVNLGKMEISLYFNGKHPEELSKTPNSVFQPYVPTTRSKLLAETACPCSSFRSSKDSLFSEPSDLISKILRSNDLFKDPTSTHCCDSHEQFQESTVYFELGPNRAPMTINNLKNPMKIPRFQNVMKSPAGLFPMRPKAMEILLFPKRKDAIMDYSKIVTKPPVAKTEIQVVGDKKIKPVNEELPKNEGASVKKDLTSMLEKKDNVDDSLKAEESATLNNVL